MSEIRKIIFAPLTLIGQSAISVIRVSGEGTFELVSNIVSKSFSRFELLDLSKFYPNTLHHVYIFDKDKNEAVDEVILSVFKGPHSYTGEDTVEISSHGGLYIYSKINDLLAKWGAVAAMPGEFTKRAFLNGKMDLAQAESVAELIKSRSEESRKLAFSQLTGEYSAKINSLRQELINYCSLLELELDFSEEGLEFVSRDELIMRIDTLINEFKRLVDTYYTGKLIRDGINLAIVGEPNVGKSSLFNYLLNYDRAIVSDIPGTTRDYISETLTIDGFPVNLIDTAGIRESSEEIEEAGIKKSISIRERADLLIVLKDATAGLGNDKISGDNSIIAYNKCDLLNGHSDFNCKDSLLISAKTGKNIDKLLAYISDKVKGLIAEARSSETVISSERHRNCLLKSCEHLVNARDQIIKGGGNELISIDVREAMRSIEEITGRVSNVDILNNIFSKFCIGK